MKLIKLKAVYGGAAESVRVRCLKTGTLSPVWNEAAEQGWVMDAHGPAFAAYYSPEAAATLTGEEAASLGEAHRKNSPVHF